MARIYLHYANSPEEDELRFLKQERDDVKDYLRMSKLSKKAYVDDFDDGLDKMLDRLSMDKEYCESLVVFGFSGHAGGDRLMFEDRPGRLEGVAGVLNKTNCPNLKLVFLNGCQTERSLSHFQRAGIPLIILTNEAIIDRIASRFASTFFLKLSQGETILSAFDYSCNEIVAYKSVDLKKNKRKFNSNFLSGSINSDINYINQKYTLFYKDETYLSWSLLDGLAPPVPLLSDYRNCNSRKVIIIGGSNKFYANFGEIFKEEVSQSKLVLSKHYSFEDISIQKERIQIELENADAAILCLESSKTGSFKEFTGIMHKMPYSSFVINETCNPLEYEQAASDLNLQKLFVFPEFGNIAQYKSSFPSNHNEKTLDELMKRKLVEKGLIVDKVLLSDLEEFDLEDQVIELVNYDIRPEMNSVFLLEGDQDSGLELLCKKVINECPGNPKRYSVSFKSNEGQINTFEDLMIKIGQVLASNTNSRSLKMSDPVVQSLDRLGNSLLEQDICFVFDDPFVSKGSEIVVQFCKEISKYLSGQDILKNSVRMVVLNKDKQINYDFLLKRLKGIQGFQVFRLPKVCEIDEFTFDKWLGQKKNKLKVNGKKISALDKATILNQPQLGKVLESLCYELNCASLISELLPDINK